MLPDPTPHFPNSLGQYLPRTASGTHRPDVLSPRIWCPAFLEVPAFLSSQMLMPSGDVNQLLIFVQAVGNQALLVKVCPLQEGL